MLGATDIEAGRKPMFSSLGFLSSIVLWMDGRVGAADEPQTSPGFTVLPRCGPSSYRDHRLYIVDEVPIDVHDVFWVVMWISVRSFDPCRGGNGSCIVRAGASSVHFGFGLWHVGVEDVGCYGHGGREEAYVFVYGFSLIHRVMDGWKGGRCG